ncbi:MAG: hypothetical protein ACRC44_08585 [Bifidobacterium asteroides]
MSATYTETLALLSAGQTVTFSAFTQSSNSYTFTLTDQAGTVYLTKEAGGVNWTPTAGAVAIPSSAAWPVYLTINGASGNVLSVLSDIATAASSSATYIASYLVAVDDGGTSADKDFNDLVLTLNVYRSVG